MGRSSISEKFLHALNNGGWRTESGREEGFVRLLKVRFFGGGVVRDNLGLIHYLLVGKHIFLHKLN